MKRRLALTTLLTIIVMVSATSCMTPIRMYYGIDTTSLPVRTVAGVYRYSLDYTYSSHDIVFSNKELFSWMTFNIDFFSSIQNWSPKKWDATIRHGDDVLNFTVTGMYIEGVNTKYYTMDDIQVKKFPERYRFRQFHLSDDWYNDYELPLTIASFSIDDKEFDIQITVMEIQSDLGIRTNGAHLADMLVYNDQIFIIADKEGRVYAEITSTGYTIFDVDTLIGEEDLWPCIGAFIVVKDIWNRMPYPDQDISKAL